MITYHKGTVFNRESEVDAIVNTVNCVGVMGAGIALEFMLRYPEMYREYKVKCDRNQMKVGKCDYYQKANSLTIINFPTKDHFKYPSQMSWIEQGLLDFVNTYQQYGIQSVAFPKLGAGRGGLAWREVKILMEKYLGGLEIDVHLCEDTLPVAEGIEKSMLDALHSMDVNQLAKHMKLTPIQKESIIYSMPYDRFWKITETKSIDLKMYRALFTFFYQSAISSTSNLNSNIDTQGTK